MPPLSTTLPPLIMGTATFNAQYNEDPFSLPTTQLVQQALETGIRAFDTSPYYGPAEELLGQALASVRDKHPRRSYHLLTKVGRVGGASFDYSPSWVRKCVRRSLERLRTDYLDVVYCHDVEFVPEERVVEVVLELRRIRDANRPAAENASPLVRYIGISGYPVDVLVRLAQRVLRETGEPLDVVMSYANYTLQNTRLLSAGLSPLVDAGVDVVLNASPLGMGLLRRSGVPVGSMGDFHPAPAGLRDAVRKASDWLLLRDVDEEERKIELVAIRFALQSWLRHGARAGAMTGSSSADRKRLGITVLGVSNMDELRETLRVWSSVVNNSLDSRQQQEDELAQGIRFVLGSEWFDYTWPSPPVDFVNSLSPDHLALKESMADIS